MKKTRNLVTLRVNTNMPINAGGTYLGMQAVIEPYRTELRDTRALMAAHAGTLRETRAVMALRVNTNLAPVLVAASSFVNGVA
jgi:hypothetical protein